MIIYIFLFLLGSKGLFSNSLISNVKDEILKNDSDYSIYIKDLTQNKTLISINPHKLLKPASNLKLVIGASILKGLGTRYRYQTKVYIDQNQNLIIKGSGDPSFIQKNLKPLIAKLKKLKINKINHIIGIKDVFDNQRLGIMWSWDDLTNCYSAQISGLQINHNCIKISVTHSKLDMPTKVFEGTGYLYIKNNSYTRLSPQKKLHISRQRNTNTVIIDGDLGLYDKPIIRYITVNEPSKYFLNIVHEMLENNKILVEGKQHIAAEIGYKLNKKLKPILSINSKYIKFLLRDFLQHSINLYGESFLKTLGYTFFNKGSTYNGRIATKMLLRSYKLPETEVFIADGSGLSELNLASSYYFTSLLKAVYHDTFYRTFKETLSIAGIAGTLKKSLNSNSLKGRVFAKTGHLNGVTALSGYLYTNTRKVLAFSMIFNKVKNNREVEKLIKKTLKSLEKY